MGINTSRFKISTTPPFVSKPNYFRINIDIASAFQPSQTIQQLIPQPSGRNRTEKMSDEESYEYEYDDDEMDEEGFQYTDEEEEANDGEVALGRFLR